MEDAASTDRDESWRLFNALQVGREGRAYPPYDRGVKFAQAVISQTREGNWKLTLQSDKQVEMMLEADAIEALLKELKFAATREWERRS